MPGSGRSCGAAADLCTHRGYTTCAAYAQQCMRCALLCACTTDLVRRLRGHVKVCVLEALEGVLSWDVYLMLTWPQLLLQVYNNQYKGKDVEGAGLCSALFNECEPKSSGLRGVQGCFVSVPYGAVCTALDAQDVI
eukprot:scaffold142228_cov22-Tisochrysis_lutea.AAC.1